MRFCGIVDKVIQNAVEDSLSFRGVEILKIDVLVL